MGPAYSKTEGGNDYVEEDEGTNDASGGRNLGGNLGPGRSGGGEMLARGTIPLRWPAPEP